MTLKHRNVLLALLCLLAVGPVIADDAATQPSTQPAQAIELRFHVKVPPTTPPDAKIFIAGSDETAFGGSWKADGLPMNKQPDGTYMATISVPPGSKLEYKITRGSWDTVEKNADGTELDNRSLTPTEPQTIEVTVAAWRDKAK